MRRRSILKGGLGFAATLGVPSLALGANICPPRVFGQSTKPAEACEKLIPSWAGISSGSVVQINSSIIQDVVPEPNPGGGYKYIINAWNGGTIVTLTNGEKYYLVRGGGHSNYAGNETYLYGPLMSENPVWARDHGPSTPIEAEVLWQSDGLPSSSHTRNTLVGGPQNELWMFGQGGVWESAGVASNEIMRYEFGVGWDSQNSYVDFQGNARGVFVFNPNDGLIWMLGGGLANANLYSFNPTTAVLTQYSSTMETGTAVQGAVDPVRNRLYAHDRSRDSQSIFDLSNPNSAPVQSGFTGSLPPGTSGITYDSTRDKFTALGDSPYTTVYELDPVSLEWSTRTFEGNVSGTLSSYVGHYSRWQYVPELKGTIFVGAYTSPVAFYKS